MKNLSKIIPQATLLINTKTKWGFDFALDTMDDEGNVFEVLHIEYDDYDYYNFINKMLAFEYKLRHTDWIDAGRRVLDNKNSWQNLKGFEQNNWKAKFLLGWSRAEYTEKSN